MKADLLTTNHGSIITIQPNSSKGKQWMSAHVPDSRRWPSRTVDCDHRCGIDILLGAIAAGLHLRDTTTGRVK